MSGPTEVPFILAVPREFVEAVADEAAAIVTEGLEAQRSPYLTASQAATYLACSKHRIYALSSAGRIPTHRDGSRLLFRPEELDAWIENGGGIRP